MFKQLISFNKLSNFFSGRNSLTMLGRWEHRINKNHEEIKFVQANSDHCGDKICGDPKIVNELLKKNSK